MRFRSEILAVVFIVIFIPTISLVFAQVKTENIMEGSTEERQNRQAAWIIEHSTKSNTYWDSQFRLNEKLDARFAAIETRLTLIEKRIDEVSAKMVGFATAASAFGAFLFRAMAFMADWIGKKREAR